jgi:hypothetical protein
MARMEASSSPKSSSRSCETYNNTINNKIKS